MSSIQLSTEIKSWIEIAQTAFLLHEEDINKLKNVPKSEEKGITVLYNTSIAVWL